MLSFYVEHSLYLPIFVIRWIIFSTTYFIYPGVIQHFCTICIVGQSFGQCHRYFYDIRLSPQLLTSLFLFYSSTALASKVNVLVGMHLPLSQLVVRTMCFVCLPSECCHMRFPGYVIKLAVSNLNQRGWVSFWHLPTVDLKINKSVLIDRFSAVVLLFAAFVLPCRVIFQCVVPTYSDFRLPKAPLVMF